jgi:hypothetical protein
VATSPNDFHVAWQQRQCCAPHHTKRV